MITSTKPVDWFSADTAGLLTELVHAETESRRVSEQLVQIQSDELLTREGMARYHALTKMADVWSKAQVNLARALRLTPHSQYGHRSAATAASKAVSGPKPWECTGEDDPLSKYGLSSDD